MSPAVSYTHLDVYKRQVVDGAADTDAEQQAKGEQQGQRQAALALRVGVDPIGGGVFAGQFDDARRKTTLLGTKTSRRKLDGLEAPGVCLLYTSRCV